MKPSMYRKTNKNDAIFKANLFGAAISLLLLITSSAYSQPIESNFDSALTRSILLQAQILDAATQKTERGKIDPSLIDMLVQLADTQSLMGEYKNATRSLEQALQVSRTYNGLYHYSQIEIVDKWIANEIFSKNWDAVNDLYELEEHLLRRLFDPTDARLEIGLEKITAWHIRAINEDIENNKQEHYAKVQELLVTRLTVVENLLGNENPRYNFIFNNLAYVEIELEKFRQKRNFGEVQTGRMITPMKIE